MKKTLLGECISEFIGTWILIFIGCGVVASLVLNGTNISHWEVSIIWGLGVTMAIYVTGSVSGAHLNPAVTIALMIHRDFPKKKVVPYIFSQLFGAFVGAAVVYLMFSPLFTAYEAENGIIRSSIEGLATAGVFSTYPNAGINFISAIFIEAIITMFLVVVILALGEDKNTNKPSSNLAPIMIGFTIAIIGGSFGVLTGFAMNPARDFGPKLFTLISGWGSNALGQNMYFIVPIIGPIIGAISAGFIYDNFIKVYLPKKR